MDFAVPLNAIAFQGNLIVAELGMTPGAAKVSLQSDNGRVVLADAEDGLAVPSGLAASEDDLWVADWATGNILQLIKKGEKLEVPILIATGLAQPEGLTVGPSGELLVVETGAGRVTKLEQSTQNNNEEMVKSIIVDKLTIGIAAPPNAPPTWVFSGIAIDSHGALYVANDVEGKILKIEQ